MVKRKRKTRRTPIAVKMLGKGTHICRTCWPENELHKDSNGEPLDATIYVGRKVIKVNDSKITLLIAWCAECQRWLAKQKRWRITLDKVDVASALSDGECGKGNIDWEEFIRLVGWKDRGK